MQYCTPVSDCPDNHKCNDGICTPTQEPEKPYFPSGPEESYVPPTPYQEPTQEPEKPYFPSGPEESYVPPTPYQEPTQEPEKPYVPPRPYPRPEPTYGEPRLYRTASPKWGSRSLLPYEHYFPPRPYPRPHYEPKKSSRLPYDDEPPFYPRKLHYYPHSGFRYLDYDVNGKCRSYLCKK